MIISFETPLQIAGVTIYYGKRLYSWPFSRCMSVLCASPENMENSGVFRISKRGAKWCSLATSAHTKGVKPSFPICLLCKKKIFGQRGAMADLAKG